MNRWIWTHAVQILVVIILLASAEEAHAQATLGASFGYSHLSYTPEFDASNDVIGIPNLQDWGQPGLRIGYLFPGSEWAVNTDVGFFHRSGTVGPDLTSFEMLPQVQLSPWTRNGYSPFASVGVGLEHETADFGSSSDAATRATFGAALGVRKSVSKSKGFLRAELRYDYLPKSEKALSPSASVIYPETNAFSVRLGFDLVLSR